MEDSVCLLLIPLFFLYLRNFLFQRKCFRLDFPQTEGNSFVSRRRHLSPKFFSPQTQTKVKMRASNVVLFEFPLKVNPLGSEKVCTHLSYSTVNKLLNLVPQFHINRNFFFFVCNFYFETKSCKFFFVFLCQSFRFSLTSISR